MFLKSCKPSEQFHRDAASTVRRVSLVAATLNAARVVTIHEATEGDAGRHLTVWDWAGADAKQLAVEKTPHNRPLTAVVLTDDGKVEVTAATDGMIKLWPL